MDKREYRNQALIESIEKIADEICSEKTSNHHRDKFFPLLIEKLGLKRGAEVGVDKGEFSYHILSKTDMEIMYCIDPWIDDFGSDHKPDYYDPDGNVRMTQAMNTLAEFGDRAKLIRKTSVCASGDFNNNSLDFVYIDGDHSLEMLLDLYAWVHKVRKGGILSGHDMKDGRNSGIMDYWGLQLDYQVKTCVEYFCRRYGFKLNVIGGRILSWWFVKNY